MRRVQRIFDDRKAQKCAFLSFYVSDMAGCVLFACQREKCMLCSERAMLSEAGGADAADCRKVYGHRTVGIREVRIENRDQRG